ncbi:MAG: hypothetical protein IPQ09_31105 [Myxococcales bacterium]|nr:hypothetical protein [Myxococcales bacterium]
MTISLASLILKETRTTIYNYALNITTSIKLPVTSWQMGDPTRSLYHVLSAKLKALEANVAGTSAAASPTTRGRVARKVNAEHQYGAIVP